AGSGDRGVDLPGQLGSDLDRHKAVGPGGRVVDRAEDGEGGGDVGDHQLPVGVLDRDADGGQGGELFVVVGRTLDGPGENRRVGGDAADPVADHAGQGAVAQVTAGEVVEPRALALL